MPNYWLKVAGDREHTIDSDWRADYERWRQEQGPVSAFPRRPRVRTNDFLILYAAGSPGIYGEGKIYVVEFVTSDARPGEHPRWPWVVEAENHVAGPPLENCPGLSEIGVSTRSVRQQSHIHLTIEQGAKAVWLIAKAAGSTAPP
jgi:hypothetical protein